MNGAAVACSIVLVLVMAILGVTALRTVTHQIATEITTVQQGTSLGSSLVSAVLGEIRAAEQYLLIPSPAVKAQFLASGDSAYTVQARLRDLPHLSGNDRHLINQVANIQADLEVSYATAHALADIGQTDQARLIAMRAGGATDSLIAVVRALNDGQIRRAVSARATCSCRPALFRGC